MHIIFTWAWYEAVLAHCLGYRARMRAVARDYVVPAQAPRAGVETGDGARALIYDALSRFGRAL